MVASAVQWASGPVDFEFLIYVDSDDPKKNEYISLNCNRVIVGERVGLGPAYQALFQHARFDIVMMCADDILFRTSSWDRKVIEAMPQDLIGVVSCNELPKGKREHGHPFIGRRFIEEMGYICHPDLKHSCVDTWVRSVAEGIGRFYYLDDVITEHVHPKYGKGQWDSTYQENDRVTRERDGRTFKNGQKEIQQTIMRVAKYLNENSLVHRLG